MPRDEAGAKPLLGAGVGIPCRSWENTEDRTKEGAGVLGRNESHQGDRGRGSFCLRPSQASVSQPRGGLRGQGRALASSEAVLVCTTVLCKPEEPAPKKDQDSRKASSRGQQSRIERGTMRHQLQQHNTYVGQDSTLRGRSSRPGSRWPWSSLVVVVSGGREHPASPATPPSVGKLANCRPQCPPLPSPLLYRHLLILCHPISLMRKLMIQRVMWEGVEVGTPY